MVEVGDESAELFSWGLNDVTSMMIRRGRPRRRNAGGLNDQEVKGWPGLGLLAELRKRSDP